MLNSKMNICKVSRSIILLIIYLKMVGFKAVFIVNTVPQTALFIKVLKINILIFTVIYVNLAEKY